MKGINKIARWTILAMVFIIGIICPGVMKTVSAEEGDEVIVTATDGNTYYLEELDDGTYEI